MAGRRRRLRKNTFYLWEGLAALGFDIGNTQTPIIRVLLGDEKNALELWRRLFDPGVFTSPIIPPAVPADSALIPLSCLAGHTIDQLERVLDAFEGPENNWV